MKTKTRTARPVQDHPELAPPGSPPHIAIAPGLLGQDHVVIRSTDDTDEDYLARCRLLDAMLAYAHKD